MRIQLVLAGTLLALGPTSASTLLAEVWPRATPEPISDPKEAALEGAHEDRGGVTDDQAASVEESEADAPASALPVAPPALPNLQVIGITHTDYQYWDGTYSVAFNVQVKNVGGAGTLKSFSVSARGWALENIFTCTGTWCAQSTTLAFAPGETRTVRVAGPGYVGPRSSKGVSFTVTAHADPYCSIAESSESDNSRSKLIVVGF